MISLLGRSFKAVRLLIRQGTGGWAMLRTPTKTRAFLTFYQSLRLNHVKALLAVPSRTNLAAWAMASRYTQALRSYHS